MLCVPLRTKLLSGLQLDRKLSLHTIKGQTDNRIQTGAQKNDLQHDCCRCCWNENEQLKHMLCVPLKAFEFKWVHQN